MHTCRQFSFGSSRLGNDTRVDSVAYTKNLTQGLHLMF